jgi:hypothetical protein
VKVKEMSEYMMESTEIDNSKFPYRYLLRWSWPDHIESLIRRLMWTWLTESSSDESNGESNQISEADFIAMRAMWLIAVQPESPGAMLQIIAEQCSEAFVERVAENPGTWPSTLRTLAKHASAKVRVAVSQNSNTPSDVLFELAHDESADVRYAMAEGVRGDAQLLHHLMEDENAYVASRAKRTLARLTPPAMAQMPFRKAASEKTGLRKAAES